MSPQTPGDRVGEWPVANRPLRGPKSLAILGVAEITSRRRGRGASTSPRPPSSWPSGPARPTCAFNLNPTPTVMVLFFDALTSNLCFHS